MDDTFISLFAVLSFGFVMGFILGTKWQDAEWSNLLFERGYMVECIGKEGYFWECER
jgi:hypothetical protein